LVIYSEGGGYWTFFEPVFRALRDEFDHNVLYVTSSHLDPVFLSPPEGLRTYCVGSGSFRTIFFSSLDVDVLVMTMPDLQTFHIKRSPLPVKYVYLHHSMVSTHMAYRRGAFDHFDAILCVGPHHVDENRAWEQLKKLPRKQLIEHGYSRLDIIMMEAVPAPRHTGSESDPIRVLVAPTWGDHAILEAHGHEVVRNLLNGGVQVTVRPQPHTRIRRPEVIDDLLSSFGQDPRFLLDEDGNGRDSLLSADVMVSDWSGAALEFSFGLERPIIFIDVPKKVLNPEFDRIGLEPLEVQIRSKIGIVLGIDQLDRLGALVRSSVAESDVFKSAAQQIREKWIFNNGRSGSAAATYLHSLVSN